MFFQLSGAAEKDIRSKPCSLGASAANEHELGSGARDGAADDGVADDRVDHQGERGRDHLQPQDDRRAARQRHCRHIAG